MLAAEACSQLEHFLAVMFIGPPGNPADILRRKEFWSPERCGTDEDLRRLLDHEHGCLHRFGRSPDGDHAVILEKDHAWEDTRILDKAERLAANGLAQL